LGTTLALLRANILLPKAARADGIDACLQIGNLMDWVDDRLDDFAREEGDIKVYPKLDIIKLLACEDENLEEELRFQFADGNFPFPDGISQIHTH
jgi:hypothetical protein